MINILRGKPPKTRHSKLCKTLMDPIWSLSHIQLLEYPIPPRARPRTSQKPPSADISETKSGIIDPLVSKQQEEEKSINNNWRRKNQDKRNEIFGFLCDRFWIYVIFLDISNALSHYCTVAWVTRPERPKGVKDIIPKGRYLEVGQCVKNFKSNKIFLRR